MSVSEGPAKSCIHCRHSMTTPEMAPQGAGMCCRYPPAVFPLKGPDGQLNPMSIRPIVRLTHDSCGEWAAGVKIEPASTLRLMGKGEA